MAKRELELPNNSFKKRQEDKAEAERERARDPAAPPSATLKKRSIGQKFIDTFVAEDAKTVKGYLLSEVILPSLESLFLDTLHQGIDAFFNKNNRYTGRGEKSRPYRSASYDAYYNRRGDRGRSKAEIGGKIKGIEEIIFNTRQDAQLVKVKMQDLLEQEQAISIDEYYEIVHDVTGLTVNSDNYLDAKYGWMDLTDVTVTMARGGGYVINMPTPVNVYD